MTKFFCNFRISKHHDLGIVLLEMVTTMLLFFCLFQKHRSVCLVHWPAKLLCQHVHGMTRMKERGARAGFGWRVMNHFCPCITLATATSELALPHQDIGIKEVEAPEVCFKDGVKKLSG